MNKFKLQALTIKFMNQPTMDNYERFVNYVFNVKEMSDEDAEFIVQEMKVILAVIDDTREITDRESFSKFANIRKITKAALGKSGYVRED